MANNLLDKDGKLNANNYRKKVEKQQQTFATLDASMAILEKLPELMDVGLDFLNADSFTFATNPMEFLINILKTLGVEEDELREWITEFLVKVLPAVEMGVKAYLLSSIKSIISCNFDPRIPWYLRKKEGDTVYIDLLRNPFLERGIDIPLSAIDNDCMLDLSPFTEPGSEYYFGQSEGINEDSNSKVAKLARADDFNAFLWYVIHKGNKQNPIAVDVSGGGFEYGGKSYSVDSTSMKGVVTLRCAEGDEFIAGTTFCDSNNPKEVLICIEKTKGKNTLIPLSSDWQSCNWYVNKNRYYDNNIAENEWTDNKPRDYKKEKPICNLMYADIENYYGTGVPNTRIGIDALRFSILPKPAVILPNVYKVGDEKKELKGSWHLVRLLFDADGTPNSKGKYSLPGEISPTITPHEGSDWVDYDYEGTVVSFNSKTGEYKLKSEDGVKGLIECYPGLTVYEFNYDFIMGMRLFDSKVVCKKLLSSATNSKYMSYFRLTANKQKGKSSSVDKKLKIIEIVRKIIETDDEEINDCFFTFSNDEYDELLRKTAELKYNQSPYTEGYGDGQVIDLSSVDKILADYPQNGTLQEQKDVINRALAQACDVIEKTLNPEYKNSKSAVKISFLTNIFQQLALCLIDSLLSPKVLLLIAVNNILMQESDETSPITTEQLMSMAKNVITGLIKELRDLVMQKMLDYIVEFLTPMVLEIQAFVASEQFAAYMAIVRLLLSWYNAGVITLSRLNAILAAILSRVKKGNYDDDNGDNYELASALDNVDYADIFADALKEREPIINDCQTQ